MTSHTTFKKTNKKSWEVNFLTKQVSNKIGIDKSFDCHLLLFETVAGDNYRGTLKPIFILVKYPQVSLSLIKQLIKYDT